MKYVIFLRKEENYALDIKKVLVQNISEGI